MVMNPFYLFCNRWYVQMENPKRTPNTPHPNLMNALCERQQHIVHLTHNDLDAVGADAIHRRKYGDVFTVWCSVGKFVSLLGAVAGAPGRGDILSISDLGYQAGVEERIKKARSNGWRIEWRDHHRWRDDEIGRVRALVEILHIDTSTCGAGIVAQDLLPDDPWALEVARVTCDYDLWIHADPRSKMLGQVVMQKGNREYVRDRFVEGILSDPHIEQEYASIMREMEESLSRSMKHATIMGKKYRIAFAPLYQFPSETAHGIRDRLNTDIEVVISRSGRFSIRSVPPISHLIARHFNGGGHPHAAGGDFRFSTIDRLWFLLFKKNAHFADLVGVAESLKE
jgi:oligoribonuclease NrnB/cAMP/cGMP phosphodiesterase (DHH superfamily)